ncbi:MAG: hypothetical protein U0168_05995 [Nannocystaceae bacterium]
MARPAGLHALYREYGEFTTSLRGVYITAEDVGTGPTDMAHVFETTRWVTCVPPAVGGSGNPSEATAKGVVCAMEGALDHLGKGDLRGKTVAMQGAGNVAAYMIETLLQRGVGRVVATDIDAARLDALRQRWAARPVELRLAAPGDRSIFAEPCDVFAPNALGGVLEPETIAMLRTPIVCGAANNQLLDDRRDDGLLAQRGIAYVPDFVANRMGIVNCANEQYGRVEPDPAIERHFGRDWDNAVYVITRRVLERAAKDGVTTSTAANALADEACRVPHPIWGHRGRAIIESLAAERQLRQRAVAGEHEATARALGGPRAFDAPRREIELAGVDDLVGHAAAAVVALGEADGEFAIDGAAQRHAARRWCRRRRCWARPWCRAAARLQRARARRRTPPAASTPPRRRDRCPTSCPTTARDRGRTPAASRPRWPRRRPRRRTRRAAARARATPRAAAPRPARARAPAQRRSRPPTGGNRTARARSRRRGAWRRPQYDRNAWLAPAAATARAPAGLSAGPARGGPRPAARSRCSEAPGATA